MNTERTRRRSRLSCSSRGKTNSSVAFDARLVGMTAPF